MRISDWSSDVCSSDLGAVAHAVRAGADRHRRHRIDRRPADRRRARLDAGSDFLHTPTSRRPLRDWRAFFFGDRPAGVSTANKKEEGCVGDEVGRPVRDPGVGFRFKKKKKTDKKTKT